MDRVGSLKRKIELDPASEALKLQYINALAQTNRVRDALSFLQGCQQRLDFKLLDSSLGRLIIERQAETLQQKLGTGARFAAFRSDDSWWWLDHKEATELVFPIRAIGSERNSTPTRKLLESLGEFPLLEELSFESAKIDGRLSEIKALPGLKRLTLSRARLTREGPVLPLKGLSHCLERLDISYLQSRAKNFLGLGRFNCLQTLIANGTKFSNVDLKELAQLENLKKLSMRDASVGSNVFKMICGNLKKLESLDLSQNKGVTNTLLASLSSLQELRSLSLLETPKLNGPGLEALHELKAMRILKLGCGMKGETLQCLALLTQVRELWLANMRFGGSKAIQLEGLTHIEHINFQGSNINAEELQYLQTWTNLKSVDLTRCSWVYSGFMRYLAPHKNLEALVIDQCPQPEDLEIMAQMENLRSLTIHQPIRNEAKVLELQRLKNLKSLKMRVSFSTIEQTKELFSHIEDLQLFKN